MDALDEIVADFLLESSESLDRYEVDLLLLEQDPRNRDAVDSVFRAMHTIKGTCGFLGLTRLERFTHVVETLLGRLRTNDLWLDTALANLLLEAGDAVRGVLEEIRLTGADDPALSANLLARLTQAAERRDRLGERLVAAGLLTDDDVELALRQQALGDARPIGEILTELAGVGSQQIEAALSSQAAERREPETVRVDIRLLDELMCQVADLASIRDQIVDRASEVCDRRLVAAASRLDQLTVRLEGDVMRTRMQPVGTAWSRLPRVVRHLAQQSGKSIELVREGEDTELDRTVLEAIKDPMIHLVRNAIDHGIETPDEREAAGKPPVGRLFLRAFRDSSRCHIDIRDDGRGVDVERVRRKGVEQGLISEREARVLDEREILLLILRPGFSTASSVTSVSGRGVGMDVVRSNLVSIGGDVDMRSTLGEGTTFTLSIPIRVPR